jgi:hypothetical protein
LEEISNWNTGNTVETLPVVTLMDSAVERGEGGGGIRYKLPAPGGPEGALSQTMLLKFLPFSTLSLFVALQVNPFRQSPVILQLKVSLPI